MRYYYIYTAFPVQFANGQIKYYLAHSNGFAYEGAALDFAAKQWPDVDPSHRVIFPFENPAHELIIKFDGAGQVQSVTASRYEQMNFTDIRGIQW